nr:MAG TPA: hypothetical protein [Caudoviricetes sp.]
MSCGERAKHSIQRYLNRLTKVKSQSTSYMAIFAYEYYTTIRKLR